MKHNVNPFPDLKTYKITPISPYIKIHSPKISPKSAHPQMSVVIYPKIVLTRYMKNL